MFDELMISYVCYVHIWIRSKDTQCVCVCTLYMPNISKFFQFNKYTVWQFFCVNDRFCLAFHFWLLEKKTQTHTQTLICALIGRTTFRSSVWIENRAKCLKHTLNNSLKKIKRNWNYQNTFFFSSSLFSFHGFQTNFSIYSHTTYTIIKFDEKLKME